MTSQPLRPMCFIAMPFGKRKVGSGTSVIDFDLIHTFLSNGAQAAGLEPIRADFESAGGFIHKPMFERLLVAEYVIADLSLANPNVTYEVGVQHGATARATLLVCADRLLQNLPFDFRPLRILPYKIGNRGSLSKESGKKLSDEVRNSLTQARTGQIPVDNPIMQITAWKPCGNIEHSKTDVFLQRLQYTGKLGERIKAAIISGKPDQALLQLIAIEEEIIGLPADVAQVHTALLGVYLGYRELKAYSRMQSLFDLMPKELQQTAVAREQYALALNRLAEQSAKKGDAEEADGLRNQALRALDEIPQEAVTSETYGVRGRIYKGWHDALEKPGAEAAIQAKGNAMLQKAIETYEQGFRADLRDYYPGVNAVTLRLLRDTEQDRSELRALIPVVRYSVASAPAPKNKEESYWQTATRLELACADRDWGGAGKFLDALLGIDVADWFRETTSENLTRQKKASADPVTISHLEKILASLRS